MVTEPTFIFEDKDFLVLNKPSGMTVNKADTTRSEETIQDWVEHRFKIQDSRLKNASIGSVNTSSLSEHSESKGMSIKPQYDPIQEFYKRGGIVHRLDKETSGILLVAKNPQAFARLKQQFMERTVKKTYLALAHGIIQPENGEISVPIGRLEFNRKRFGVVAGGREAKTIYKVISNFQFSISNLSSRAESNEARDSHRISPHNVRRNDKGEILSLVELFPQTGRTHQIRVHLKHINHPIFSDELYAGRKVSREDRRYLPRLFLHASEISFMHPATNQPIHIESPLPEDLREFLDILEKV